MKTHGLLALFSLAVAMTCCGCARQSETSAAREWNFNMEKVWELGQTGENGLFRPAEPRVAGDGTLYFHDFETHLSYIIDPDGRLAGTFAPRGSNEGQVSFYLNCFTTGDRVVICSPDKLHFFTAGGDFVKAVPNNLFVSFPLAFKNENEYWVAPGALGDAPGGMAVVTKVNLTSGEETIVHEFVLSDEEKQPTGGGVIVGLTPQIKMGYDRESNMLYFGKNNDTLIYRVSGDGGGVETFSFPGVRQPVSEADKRNHFAQFNIPEERVVSMVEALPDHMAYYHAIQVMDGLVYLLGAEVIGHTQSGLVVSIFSPDGRHLYHGRIQVEEGWHISNPDNMHLARGSVYAVQENDTGDKKIVKYKITLPAQKRDH